MYQFDSFRTIVGKYSRFILTTHISPDGDGLGTEVALALYLKNAGKHALILNCSATPDNYKFLEEIYPILQFDPAKHTDVFNKTDVILVMDTNHRSRLADIQPLVASSKAVKICIDHHMDPEEFADLYITDEDATATGEIMYRLISYLTGRTIDKPTAIALYTAIMTDTGSFRYPKTDPETHKITAHLVQMGADPSSIYEKVYEHGSLNRLHLLGMALASIQLAYDGKLAYLILTKDMFQMSDTSDIDTDAFVPYTLAINGVQVGIMFSELDGLVKVNFRSKGDIWINNLAKEFGGNGHKNAAGARIPHAKLGEIVKQVIEHVAVYLT